ncbi:hypothetical protein D3C76_169660 [compost metagenome]
MIFGFLLLAAFAWMLNKEYHRRECKRGNHAWVYGAPFQLRCKHCGRIVNNVPHL